MIRPDPKDAIAYGNRGMAYYANGDLDRAIADCMTNAKSITRYFYGSNRGLKVGEYILPPLVTGRDSLANYGAHKVCRKDRVYVSVAQTDAQGFACRSENKDPVVYEVEPEGELEADPDCASGVSFACEKAKIVAVHKIPGKNIKKARKEILARLHRNAKEAQ